ncbi:CO(2)-response secreted protease-like [Oryza brachyantha]|uniref:CO(2)-response secreted protease-like n=1 Tax=Oryza brachyantha TaxID=4533 RepID=UPI001ADAC2BC|nr:CO(2)-response secreted protease-like [Oryza brachyantha]
MDGSIMFWLSLFLLALLAGAGDAAGGRGGGGGGERRGVYVVYMGAVPPRTSPNFLHETHLRLVSGVLTRGKPAENVVVQQYTRVFSGFAARLSEPEAAALRRKPGVVSVFADPVYHLHTTRSWDFLQQQTAVVVKTDRARRRRSSPDATATATAVSSASSSSATADTIIGLLDSGVWPESPSFDDAGFGPVPSRWKGVCMAGDGFNSSNCNRKLIGARYYDLGVGEVKKRPSARSSGSSPRDEAGHGTHTSSTAAGNAVTGASYYGLAPGTAKGGSAASRVAMYRVCSDEGCAGSAILAGFDDAVADGVDVISVSLGASPYFRPDFSEDPIAIGSFHAVAKGVMVVCSAGNAGPDAATVVNAAPWILTVAASTIDRYFESDVVLGGNNTAVKGGAINFSNLDKSPKYPLITGESAKSSSVSDTESASHCEPGTLDASKIKGKIVLCHHSRNSDTSKLEKVDELKSAGAVGSVLVDDLEKAVSTAYVDFPVTEITSAAAADIHKYIASTSEPVATITPTITFTEYKPAPVVAYFSSRGPSAQTPNILKPDVAAPGVNILASWIPTTTLPPGEKKPSQFNLVSGTSMACPHVAGAAATVKAWNPTWSPAAIRSAIMTTATQLNNDKAPMTTDSGSPATPYDYGAGQVSPTGALDAGLVYELGEDDYLQFLCNYGYGASQIKLIASSLPAGFTCAGAGNASKDLISDLNYPSIAVTGLGTAGSRTVSRVVTNVGAQREASYAVTVAAPAGLDVKVVPSKLEFTESVQKLGFQVTFSVSGKNAAAQADLSGSITWSDGKHTVRSPFVVSS